MQRNGHLRIDAGTPGTRATPSSRPPESGGPAGFRAAMAACYAAARLTGGMAPRAPGHNRPSAGSGSCRARAAISAA